MKMPHDSFPGKAGEEDGKVELDLTTQDLRKTQLWHEISSFYKAIEEPAFDVMSHAEDIVCSPDGKTLMFTGSYWPKSEDDAGGDLQGMALMRICFLDLQTKALRTVTHGPNNDRAARWSPDGKKVVFLSDRKATGVFQSYILHFDGFGEAEPLTPFEGAAVEYADWSPDGKKILFLTASLDTKNAAKGDDAQWLPAMQSSSQEDQRRKLWTYEVNSKQQVRIGNKTRNPWEACWAGSDRVALISSASTGEEHWYHSDVCVIDVKKNAEKEIAVYQYNRNDEIRQFGALTSSSDGRTIAFVRCLSSDRGLTAGDVHILWLNDDLDVAGKRSHRIPMDSVDVTDLRFFDDTTLLYIGVSGIGISAGGINVPGRSTDLHTPLINELFKSSEGVAEWFYPKLSPIRNVSSPLFVIVLQSRTRPPTIGVVIDEEFQELHAFSHAGCDWVRSKLGESRTTSWESADGLEIHGLLDLPRNTVSKPYPLILHVHGGPTASWQNCWAGWPGWTLIQHLVSRGYAVLSPNPRGSTGRGQDFAEKVLGDVGGLETQDHLTGIAHLISQGIADPERIAVMGASHGGFMASWLITQETRFKACVSMAGVNDWHSMHFTSNIRNFDTLFFQDDPYCVGKDSHYFSRSPISMAGNIKTPVMQIMGGIDATVDQSQGKEFHNALCENGVESVLAIYPGEGHGIKAFPAVIDYTVRTVGWFEKWMPSDMTKKPDQKAI